MTGFDYPFTRSEILKKVSSSFVHFPPFLILRSYDYFRKY